MAATSVTVDDDGELSSTDDEVVAERGEGKHAPCSTAGLFIHHSTDKPLPLTSQRSIPLPRFWKKSSGAKLLSGAAPDVLRRTGSTSALFSKEEPTYQKHLVLDAPTVLWECSCCNHENLSASDLCALCGSREQHALRSRQITRNSEDEVSPFNHRVSPPIAVATTARHILRSSERLPFTNATAPTRNRDRTTSINTDIPATPRLPSHGLRASHSMPLDSNYGLHIDGTPSSIRPLGAMAEETDEYSFYSFESPRLLAFVKHRLGTRGLSGAVSNFSNKSSLNKFTWFSSTFAGRHRRASVR